MKTQKIQLKLQNVKIQYPHLSEPFAWEANDTPCYSAEFTFEAADNNTKALIWNKALEAASALFDAEKAKAILNYRKPWKDGSKYGPGLLAIKAKSRFAPQVFNQARGRMSPSEISEYIRGGALVNVILEPHAYNKAGNSGVGFYLAAVQLVKESDWQSAIGNGNDLADCFEDVPMPADNNSDPF